MYVCMCMVDDDDDGIIKPEGETWAQFNRLCLATFDKKGNKDPFGFLLV